MGARDGVLEEVVQFLGFLGSNFAGVSPYVLMLLVLMIKPYGLFGTPEIERV